jgi:PPOX class probable F420-dependent enzyme
MASLTKERLDAFLARPLIARLGTITPDGFPYVAPVWYEWDGKAIVFSARARARFVANIRANPRVCVSIAEDADPLTRVLILGRAELLRDAAPDRDEWLEWSRRICRRYLGEGAGDDYQDETIDRPSVWYRIISEETISWDSPEWHPRYYR